MVEFANDRDMVSVNPRLIAFDILQAVHNNDAYANLALPSALDAAKLSDRDAGLATEITYGALRRQGSLDAVIDACVDRELDTRVRDVCRIGSYQLLFMRIPSHAAVSESVDLARHVAGVGASKFVNAVLRRVSQHDWDKWLEIVTADVDNARRLAITYSYPEWVVRSLADAYDVDAEGVVEILEAGNVPAEVTLAARPGQCTRDELLAQSHGTVGTLTPWSVVMSRTSDGPRRPGDIELIRSGRAGVQDEGSQLVAQILATASVVGDESHWLDMCAGPGGKAALLAGLAAERGADLVALEPIESRARLVENSLRHAPGSPKVIVTDAREFSSAVEFDRILIDAPCTGLGALRRRPEARWRKQPSDVPTLAKLQRELLAHAATMVRVGGVIGYATCSPHRAETDAIVEDFLRKNSDFEVVEINSIEPAVASSSTPYLRLRPDIQGTDGMFLALLRRIR